MLTIQGDPIKKQEIETLIQYNVIIPNYNIASEFFVKEIENHSDVIDLWREKYEILENKNKFKVMKLSSLKKSQTINSNHNYRYNTHQIIFLQFEKNNNQISYTEIVCDYMINTVDEKILELIKSSNHEL